MIIVVVINGEETSVRGKVAKMVWWLVRNERKLNAIGKGSVKFDFNHTTLKASCTEAYEAISIK
jgi:hypothetical protein